MKIMKTYFPRISVHLRLPLIILICLLSCSREEYTFSPKTVSPLPISKKEFIVQLRTGSTIYGLITRFQDYKLVPVKHLDNNHEYWHISMSYLIAENKMLELLKADPDIVSVQPNLLLFNR